jgi:hypothetical protein
MSHIASYRSAPTCLTSTMLKVHMNLIVDSVELRRILLMIIGDYNCN